MQTLSTILLAIFLYDILKFLAAKGVQAWAVWQAKRQKKRLDGTRYRIRSTNGRGYWRAMPEDNVSNPDAEKHWHFNPTFAWSFVSHEHAINTIAFLGIGGIVEQDV